MTLPQMDTEKLALMTAVRCDYVRLYRQAGDEPHWEVIEVRVREAVRKLERERAEKRLVQPFRDAGWVLGSFFKEVERMATAFSEGLLEAFDNFPGEDRG